jgi:hypothetical protein
MKKIQLFVVAAILFGAISMQAQIVTPSPSPLSTLTQRFALTDVTVEYSRPSAKDRAIFGKDGLVPFGNIWRTGANNATKITFSTDVKVEGVDLKKGSYAILTKPNEMNWEVQFHAYEGSNFVAYTEKTPTATVMVKPSKIAIKFETFLITFDNLSNTGATMQIIWENTVVPVKITADADATVMANINRILGGPTSNDYYAAGSYLHDSNKDLNKALEYVRKATQVEKPAFWQVRKEALILADLGRKAEAIEAAKKSLALATEAKNNDYISMNQKSIAEWSKK